jgi:hypothetical protein
MCRVDCCNSHPGARCHLTAGGEFGTSKRKAVVRASDPSTSYFGEENKSPGIEHLAKVTVKAGTQSLLSITKMLDHCVDYKEAS